MLHGDALKEELGQTAWGHVEQRVGQMAKAVIDGGADFLFGAGMSAEANKPAGLILARDLLREIFPDQDTMPDDALEVLAKQAPLEAIADAVVDDLSEGRKSLANRLSATLKLEEENLLLPQAHKDFAALSRFGGPTCIRRVFTTNWDDLLSRAFGDSAQKITEKNSADYEQALIDGKIPIVHLHGLLDEEFLVTETDIGETTRVRSVNLILLTRLFDARLFCLVGYAMSDPDLARLYRVYRDQFALRRRHNKLTYVVAPVDSYAHYDLLDRIWRKRDARFIPLTAAEFFTRLRHAVQAAASSRGVSDLLASYGWSPTELAAKTEGLKEIFDLKEDEDAYELLRLLVHEKVPA